MYITLNEIQHALLTRLLLVYLLIIIPQTALKKMNAIFAHYCPV